jgi:hypothetical protein
VLVAGGDVAVAVDVVAHQVGDPAVREPDDADHGVAADHVGHLLDPGGAITAARVIAGARQAHPVGPEIGAPLAGQHGAAGPPATGWRARPSSRRTIMASPMILISSPSGAGRCAGRWRRQRHRIVAAPEHDAVAVDRDQGVGGGEAGGGGAIERLAPQRAVGGVDDGLAAAQQLEVIDLVVLRHQLSDPVGPHHHAGVAAATRPSASTRNGARPSR